MNPITTQSIIAIFSFLFVASMCLILITSGANASTGIEIDAIVTIPDATIPVEYLKPVTSQITASEPEPTDKEVLEAFLLADKTNEHPYIATGKDNYVCSQYSVDLANALIDAGFGSGVVVRSAKYHNIGSGHIMTWATLDDSLFVIEPQNDWVFDPDTFNDSIDREIHVLRYESVESGARKATEEHQRRI